MKKVWKKIVVAALSALTVMGAVTGCQSAKDKTPEIVGSWKASMVETSGITVDFAEYAKQLGQDAETLKMDMEVREDKTFSMDMMSQKAEGTWEEKDGKYILTSDGEDQEVSTTEGKLVFEEKEADVKITFKKK